MTAISLEPLTAASFKAFGHVVAHSGDQRRFDFPAAFAHSTSLASPGMWVNRMKAHRASSLLVSSMECHPHSAQTFIPLGCGRCVVIVCESDDGGEPEPSTLRAFVTDGRQGVCLLPACWHFAFTAIDTDSDVAVLFASCSQSGGTRIADLDRAVEVRMDAATT
jgi:ureidoglycolate lyase